MRLQVADMYLCLGMSRLHLVCLVKNDRCQAYLAKKEAAAEGLEELEPVRLGGDATPEGYW